MPWCADFGDFGSVEEAVGGTTFEELAGLGAQDASEVDGLLTGEGWRGWDCRNCPERNEGVCDEAAS